MDHGVFCVVLRCHPPRGKSMIGFPKGGCGKVMRSLTEYWEWRMRLKSLVSELERGGKCMSCLRVIFLQVGPTLSRRGTTEGNSNFLIWQKLPKHASLTSSQSHLL